ncbi:hypothetical protein KA107_03385 [Candidatus Pacearchaeota archaeon]|nr:hypothetical protein [Candidatus Pacearchaeota archaeon]
MARELSDVIESKMKGLFVVAPNGFTAKIIGASYHSGGYLPEVQEADGTAYPLVSIQVMQMATPSQIRKYKAEARRTKK